MTRTACARLWGGRTWGLTDGWEVVQKSDAAAFLETRIGEKSWQVVHYWNAPVPGWHQGWVKLKQSKKSNKFYGSYKVVYPGATRRQDRECYQELALGNYGAAGGGAQTWVIIQQRP